MQISIKGFELIIFDCDGVLVDSEPIINRAHAQVLTACGYSITEEVSGRALLRDERPGNA